MEDVMTREVDKLALFKKIQQNKALLLGKRAKDAKWEKIRLELVAEGHPYFEDKTAKQIKDNLWTLSKSRTIAKVDQAKKTGSDGVTKFSDLDKLTLAILGVESPQVQGLNVPEAGADFDQSPSTSEKRQPSPWEIPKTPLAGNRKRKVISEDDPLDGEIKEQKLRKLRLENQLLELQTEGKLLENKLLEFQIEEKHLDINKKRTDSPYYQ